MGKWTNGQVDKWTTSGQQVGNKWVSGQVGKWASGQVGEWASGQADNKCGQGGQGVMDEQMNKK